MGRSRHQPAPLRHLTCLVYKLLCLKNPAPGNSFGSGAMETHSLQEKLPGVSLGTWKPLQCHSRSEPLLFPGFPVQLCSYIVHQMIDFRFMYCLPVAKLCLTLCNPMDCSPPSSSVHGISEARILEWVAISSCRGSF